MFIRAHPTTVHVRASFRVHPWPVRGVAKQRSRINRDREERHSAEIFLPKPATHGHEALFRGARYREGQTILSPFPRFEEWIDRGFLITLALSRWPRCEIIIIGRARTKFFYRSVRSVEILIEVVVRVIVGIPGRGQCAERAAAQRQDK